MLQSLCRQFHFSFWLAQNWVQETVQAFSLRASDKLGQQLRAAERLCVTAHVLRRSGAGVVLKEWRRLPRDLEVRRQALLQKWRQAAQQPSLLEEGSRLSFCRSFSFYEKPCRSWTKQLSFTSGIMMLRWSCCPRASNNFSIWTVWVGGT